MVGQKGYQGIRCTFHQTANYQVNTGTLTSEKYKQNESVNFDIQVLDSRFDDKFYRERCDQTNW